MPEPADNPRENRLRSWHAAATRSAVAAGLLAAVVAGVLAVNHRRFLAAEVVDSPAMQQLREQLRQSPADAALRERVRLADLALRQEYFARRQFAAWGGRLLAGLLGALALSLLAAEALHKKLPLPCGAPDYAAAQTRAAARGRWAVAGVGLAAGACAVVLATLSTAAPELPLLAEPAAAPSPLADETPPTDEELARNWPRFRGSDGLGVYRGPTVAESWDGPSGRNILWKSPIPLEGESSPVVWANRVLLTGATKDRRAVFCYDADTGRLLWHRDVIDPASPAGPPENVMEDTGYAAPTPVTDGRRVCAIFANGDIGCFDLDGNRLWTKALGNPKNPYGHASSLVYWRGLVLALFDQGQAGDGLSHLVALEMATGRQRWSVRRDVATSWATPIIFRASDDEQLVTAADPWVIAYDPADGDELWRAKAVSGDVAPSPIVAGNLVLVVTPDEKLAALRADGRGDVTASAVAWQADEGAPDIVSPVSDGKVVLMVTSAGLATCWSVTDGRKLWEHQFDTNFRSSPTLAGGRFYLLSVRGEMHVLRAGEKFELLGVSKLGEPSSCSPAMVNGRIYLRGSRNLYCIAGP
ncbi:MAG TPA: PQQ-binding-like beta-propeller repeat protein [Phycisphaerae bacterium]|nr:PQQ-binding-like beta-propeller repeat protein [Phycisphaerae bacterium]